MAAKKIRIYYRAPSHMPLWKVMEECGFMEKHGLAMEIGPLEGQRKRAAEGLNGHTGLNGWLYLKQHY